MDIVTLGIDLARNVFALHGVDATGKEVFVRPDVSRKKLIETVANIKPCLIDMEACSGAHHWSREFQKFGHTVRIIAPKFVSPYRMEGKHGKNDAADAKAICEAVARPNMKFVPAKTVEQQSLLTVHRAREGYVSSRVELINRMRGILSEFGHVFPHSEKVFRAGVNSVLEDLPGHTNFVIGDLFNELDHVEEKISTYSRQIAEIAKTNEQVKNLMKLPGIGVVTATAMVATIGNAYEFKSGRQLSAWLGLTPRQNSSGGKARLGKITKTGDGYIRKMLVMGARSILLQAEKREDSVSQWAKELRARHGYGKALVAIAAKNARMCWAMMKLGEGFKMPA